MPRAVAENRHPIPLWLANLMVFALLFSVVTGYFFWQTRQARNQFFANVRENAVMVAEVIQLSAHGSVLSKRAAEQILETFLGNTTRFIDYLDRVEPFTSNELAAFAEEAGLVGIRIQGPGKRTVEGPPGWLSAPFSGCGKKPELQYAKDKRLYLFSLPTETPPGCVTAGITDKQIRIMQENLGLENVIRTISELPRMRYVRMETPELPHQRRDAAPAVKIIAHGSSQIAEARVPMDDQIIAVALDAEYLARLVNRIWRNFFLFSGALAILGAFLSFILYRYQARHLAQVKAYERHLFAERENASLGRAAAAIAHEIRNPLNTLGMGLQRLQFEGKEITPEHQRLIQPMLDAVNRANHSVQSLLKYARPQKPSRKPVRLDFLVDDILQLYKQRCENQRITVTRDVRFKDSVSVDPELLGQVLENLIKNAVEAQPDGGMIQVAVEKKDAEASVSVKNKGFPLKPEEANRILDPYFTTKTDGTGLGLTISRKIVEAHKGRMSVGVPESATVEITVFLPLPRSK